MMRAVQIQPFDGHLKAAPSSVPTTDEESYGHTVDGPQGCGGKGPPQMLGVDVSSQFLSTALWLRPQDKPDWEREVPNCPSGIEQLLSATSKEVPWVVEPTGRYSLLVVQRAQEAGRKVLLAPP